MFAQQHSSLHIWQYFGQDAVATVTNVYVVLSMEQRPMSAIGAHECHWGTKKAVTVKAYTH